MDKLKLAEQSLVNDNIPEFKAGDTVNVHYRVREGEKERIQQFQGVVISRRGSGPNQTFICRKISAGNIGVERIFPLYSPFIAKIEPKKEGDVRRSKLYYLRELRGKAARIKEKDRRDVKGAAEDAHKEKVEQKKTEPQTEEQEKGQTSTIESAPEKAKQKPAEKQPKKDSGTDAQQEEEAAEEQNKKEVAKQQEKEAEEPTKKETAASEEE
jgi:large subunit ribosomal protein L19